MDQKAKEQRNLEFFLVGALLRGNHDSLARGRCPAPVWGPSSGSFPREVSLVVLADVIPRSADRLWALRSVVTVVVGAGVPIKAALAILAKRFLEDARSLAQPRKPPCMDHGSCRFVGPRRHDARAGARGTQLDPNGPP